MTNANRFLVQFHFKGVYCTSWVVFRSRVLRKMNKATFTELMNALNSAQILELLFTCNHRKIWINIEPFQSFILPQWLEPQCLQIININHFCSSFHCSTKQATKFDSIRSIIDYDNDRMARSGKFKRCHCWVSCFLHSSKSNVFCNRSQWHRCWWDDSIQPMWSE